VIFSVIRPRLTKEIATMALDQSALTELLDSLRAGGDLDFDARGDAARAAGAH
jgi:hypothetical protein